MAATVREYLVSLGAEVDQKSFGKMEQALKGTVKTLAGVSAAVVAMTTALVKTSISLDKTTQEYEKMAKKAKKTTEEIRAQETALKTLGKTMDEVKADKKLKAQYEELRKLGMAMALPEANDGIKTLRGILKTVEQLRVIGTYAMQWINRYMLQEIAAPLKEFQRFLNKARNVLKKEMPGWAKKIGKGLGQFLRLILAGARAIGDLIKQVKKLPPAIKEIGGAIALAFGIKAMGPIGMVLAGIAGILLLLDDYYTYKRGGNSALADLWESLDTGKMSEKLTKTFAKVLAMFNDIGSAICKEIVDALNKVDWEKAGADFGNIFTSLFTTMTDALSGKGNGSTFKLADSALTLVTTIFTSIGKALSGFLKGTKWSSILSGAIEGGGQFLTNVFDLILGTGDKPGKGKKNTKAEKGLADQIINTFTEVTKNLGNVFKKISFKDLGTKVGSYMTDLFTKIGEYFTPKEGETALPIEKLLGEGNETLKSALLGVADFILGALAGIDFSKLGGSINAVAGTFFNIIGQALDSVLLLVLGDDENEGLAPKLGDIVLGILEGLEDVLSPENISDFSDNLSGFADNLVNFITEGLDGAFALLFGDGETIDSGLLGKLTNIVLNIATNLVDAFTSTDVVDKVNDVAGSLSTFVSNSLDAALKLLLGDDENEGMAPRLLDLVLNIAGGIVDAFGQQEVTDALGDIASSVFDFIAGALDGAVDLLLGTDSGEDGVAQELLNLAIGIFEGLTEAMNGVTWDDIGTDVGSFFTSIFEKIAEAFSSEDGGESLLGEAMGDGVEFIASAAEGLMNFLLSALGAVNFSTAGDAISAILENLIGALTTGLSTAATAITGTEQNEGIASKLLDFLRSIVDGLGTAVQNIDVSKIGGQIGTFVSGLFKSIATFINREAGKVSQGKSLIGGLATTMGNIVKSIFTLLSSALKNIKLDDVKALATSLWTAIEAALNDLKTRLTSTGEDKIDFSGIGNAIGTAIGSAIKIATTFLSQFVTDAIAWIQSDGWDSLVSIGKAIVDAILQGVNGLWDGIMTALFGEDYTNAKNKNEKETERQKRINQKLAEGKSFQQANAEVAAEMAAEEEAKGERIPEQQPVTKDRFGNDLTYNDIDSQIRSEYNDFLKYGRLPEGMTSAELTALAKALEKQKTLGPDSEETPVRDVLAQHYGFSSYEALMDAGNQFGWGSVPELNIETNAPETTAELQATQQAAQALDGTTATVTTKYVVTGGGNRPAGRKRTTGGDSGGGTGSGGDGENAYGGRFSQATQGIFGEDGTEYIIPITKLSRAKQLILQMFGEMGAGASDILASLGVGGSGAGVGGPGMPASSQPAAMYPSAGGGNITSNSGNVVTAPTTINVYGSGDPLATGSAAARASENNIIRRVRGCFEV